MNPLTEEIKPNQAKSSQIKPNKAEIKSNQNPLIEEIKPNKAEIKSKSLKWRNWNKTLRTWTLESFKQIVNSEYTIYTALFGCEDYMINKLNHWNIRD